MLIVGAVATLVACIAAPFTRGASSALIAIGTTLAKIALGTAIGAAVSLAIGGTIAGIQSALTGHGFWEGFAESVQEEAVDALITSFAFTAITIAASNIMKCFQCFKEGTLVETEEGLKPIEEIEVGDKVLAYDEETGEQAYKPVVRLFRNETNEWYHIYVNGEEIICTGGHPFYVLNASENRHVVHFEGTTESVGKWVTAKELRIFDKLLLSDGSSVIIEEIQIEQLEKPETTYNFEVEDYHTYYVSDIKILVHNKCKTPYDYLDDALEQNGYTRKDIPDLVNNSPDGVWSYSWSENGVDYRLWLHKGNSQFTKAKYIFRVKSRPVGVKGWKYLGANGRWYSSQFVKPRNINFKPFLARITHIHIP